MLSSMYKYRLYLSKNFKTKTQRSIINSIFMYCSGCNQKDALLGAKFDYNNCTLPRLLKNNVTQKFYFCAKSLSIEHV